MKTVSRHVIEAKSSTAESDLPGSKDRSYELRLARDPLLHTSLLDNADPVEILGVKVLRHTAPQAIKIIGRFIKKGGTHSVYLVNAHTLNLASEDPEYRDILNGGDLVLNDGIGLDIASAVRAKRFLANLCGTDFTPELCEYAAEGGYSVFLLGGNPGIADRSAEVLKKRIPNLRICGTHHGYFDKDRCEDVLEKIRESNPHILIVGFGNPLQEEWIDMYKNQLPGCVAIGVGAFFDYLAGTERRAPQFVRALRCEWVYRLLMAPGKKWRRYVQGNPMFLYRVYKERLAGLLTVSKKHRGQER